jgi:hypothetical protein
MLTKMTEEDWVLVLEVFHACRSRRGDKGRDDRKFFEALHYFRAIGDYRTNAAFTRRLPICLRIIALVRDNGAGINIGTEVEEVQAEPATRLCDPAGQRFRVCFRGHRRCARDLSKPGSRQFGESRDRILRH